MSTTINEIEARVLGSLAEKQLTTPEYYPLTLNALMAACNQKSNRDPVMSLGESEILAAIDSLRDKNLVYLYYGSTSRTVKYKHMMPQIFELEPEGIAVMTLLLLRGPQTAGEIRGRADRLHEFGGIGKVQQALDELAARPEPLVTKLDRQPGQKEQRYAHLLSGPIDQAAMAVERPIAATGGVARIDELEAKVAELSQGLEQLRDEFAQFRRQFE
ncbi:MAG TPA: YceH family protein [Pyrinomonadaceae bacterium]|nr:YceH family protein [Pyrinomonadaceae bacterium]